MYCDNGCATWAAAATGVQGTTSALLAARSLACRPAAALTDVTAAAPLLTSNTCWCGTFSCAGGGCSSWTSARTITLVCSCCWTKTVWRPDAAPQLSSTVSSLWCAARGTRCACCARLALRGRGSSMSGCCGFLARLGFLCSCWMPSHVCGLATSGGGGSSAATLTVKQLHCRPVPCCDLTLC